MRLQLSVMTLTALFFAATNSGAEEKPPCDVGGLAFPRIVEVDGKPINLAEHVPPFLTQTQGNKGKVSARLTLKHMGSSKTAVGNEVKYEMTAEDVTTGKVIGTLRFTYQNSELNKELGAKAGLEIHPIAVEEAYQQKGVSEALLERVLRLYGPHIDKISAEIKGTNREVFWKAFDRTGDAVAAVKETPAYKIRAKQGFGDVLWVTPVDGKDRNVDIGLSVGPDR